MEKKKENNTEKKPTRNDKEFIVPFSFQEKKKCLETRKHLK
jgi:hypothetical protein